MGVDFKVGDIVQTTIKKERGIIAKIEGDCVWVKFEGKTNYTIDDTGYCPFDLDCSVIELA